MAELTDEQKIAFLTAQLANAEKFTETSRDAVALIFRTSELKKKKGLYSTPNPDAYDTKDLFTKAIESLGFTVGKTDDPGIIRIGPIRGDGGKVHIAGTPEMINRLIEAAKDATKKTPALQTSLQKFHDPNYTPSSPTPQAEAVVAQSVPNVSSKNSTQRV